MSEESNEYRRLPIVRVGVEDVPVYFANNFVVQHQQDEFFLTVGQFQPPILLGTAEERRKQLEELGYVPVKVVARLGLTRQRLVELIEVLQENLRKHDASSGDEGL
jgi:hypothetical protein